MAKPLGRLKALLGGLGLEHNGDELHTVPLGRGGQAVACRVGGAGLEASGPFIETHQLIGIGQLELTAPDGVHPNGGVVPDFGVLDQGAAHDRDIMGAGQVARRGQAGAVDKTGVGHAKLGGPLVHLLHKALLAACQVLGQGHGGVIARHHRHGLEHVVHAHLLPLF